MSPQVIRDSIRELREMVRVNPVEYFLICAAVLVLASAMSITARIATEPVGAADLDFSGTIAEASQVLRNRRPENVGKFVTAKYDVGSSLVKVDTLAITIDTISEPSFRQRGFMRDEIAAFNDAAVRRAILSATRGLDDAVSSGGASLFMKVWSDSGLARLSDTVNGTGLLIRSPFAEGNRRTVRTSDWKSGPSLIGYDGEVPLSGTDSTSAPAVLNSRSCEVRATPPRRRLLYCESQLAMRAGKFFDLGFDLPDATAGKEAMLFLDRSKPVWINGQRRELTRQAATAGDLVQTSRTGSVLLSSTEWGALSSPQWINGRNTVATNPHGTLAFFARAGRITRAQGASEPPMTLGLNAGLSADLDEASASFFAEHRDLLRRMAVVVMDVRSGAIRAISEPHRRTTEDPLMSFEPLLVGSAVKPVLAAAILSRQPSLASMQIATPAPIVDDVDGIVLQKPFHSDPNGCHGSIDFVSFLRCSNNEYAVRLVFSSLRANGMAAGVDEVSRSVLERSDLATGLAEVFDVDAYAGRTAGRASTYWSPDTAGTTLAMDRSLKPWEPRPWVLFPQTDGTKTDWLARYAFGGWENRWTLLGLAQSYARIATDRSINASFLDASPSAQERVPPNVAQSFAHVRPGLVDVAESGTGAGLSDALQIVHGNRLSVLAKTGTLNEDETNSKTRMKSLALVIGQPESTARNSALRCGVAVVEYFEFRDDVDIPKGTALPKLHLQFAESRLADALRPHWRALTTC